MSHSPSKQERAVKVLIINQLDMWLEHLYYDDSLIERQRKILCEEEFVNLDEMGY